MVLSEEDKLKIRLYLSGESDIKPVISPENRTEFIEYIKFCSEREILKLSSKKCGKVMGYADGVVVFKTER